MTGSLFDDGRKQARHALDVFGGRVDLYQVHNLVNWRGHLDTLELLQGEGWVTAIGATHYQPSAFDELRTAMNPPPQSPVAPTTTPLSRPKCSPKSTPQNLRPLSSIPLSSTASRRAVTARSLSAGSQWPPICSQRLLESFLFQD